MAGVGEIERSWVSMVNMRYVESDTVSRRLPRRSVLAVRLPKEPYSAVEASRLLVWSSQSSGFGYVVALGRRPRETALS